MNKISFIADVLVILLFSAGVVIAIYEEVQKGKEEEVVFRGMRSIGRTDKRGRPVYEGDIFYWDIIFADGEKDIERAEIVWDDEVCGFLCQSIENGAKFEIPSQDDFSKDIEVVSNHWGHKYNAEGRQ